MHIKSLVDWSLCKEAKLDTPQKGEFCWCRVKLQARDAQPANKPIVKYFFRMAITGNTNGFNYQTWHLVKKEKWQFLTRCTHRQSERERERKWLTCASSVTDPCAASFVVSRGSLCRWGQRAEVPSEGSFLFLEGPPKTCRHVRHAYSVELSQTQHDLEEILVETGASVAKPLQWYWKGCIHNSDSKALWRHWRNICEHYRDRDVIAQSRQIIPHKKTSYYY